MKAYNKRQVQALSTDAGIVCCLSSGTWIVTFVLSGQTQAEGPKPDEDESEKSLSEVNNDDEDDEEDSEEVSCLSAWGSVKSLQCLYPSPDLVLLHFLLLAG